MRHPSRCILKKSWTIPQGNTKGGHHFGRPPTFCQHPLSACHFRFLFDFMGFVAGHSPKRSTIYCRVVLDIPDAAPVLRAAPAALPDAFRNTTQAAACLRCGFAAASGWPDSHWGGLGGDVLCCFFFFFFSDVNSRLGDHVGGHHVGGELFRPATFQGSVLKLTVPPRNPFPSCPVESICVSRFAWRFPSTPRIVNPKKGSVVLFLPGSLTATGLIGPSGRLFVSHVAAEQVVRPLTNTADRLLATASFKRFPFEGPVLSVFFSWKGPCRLRFNHNLPRVL